MRFIDVWTSALSYQEHFHRQAHFRSAFLSIFPSILNRKICLSSLVLAPNSRRHILCYKLCPLMTSTMWRSTMVIALWRWLYNLGEQVGSLTGSQAPKPSSPTIRYVPSRFCSGPPFLLDFSSPFATVAYYMMTVTSLSTFSQKRPRHHVHASRRG